MGDGGPPRQTARKAQGCIRVVEGGDEPFVVVFVSQLGGGVGNRLLVEKLNELAERSQGVVTLGSFCTVFAATEILEKIRAGVNVEEIVKGAFRSVAKRILEMDTIQGAMVLTGGVVAHNPVLADLVAESFGTEAKVSPDPQYMGAFGAALFAMQHDQKGDQRCS